MSDTLTKMQENRKIIDELTHLSELAEKLPHRTRYSTLSDIDRLAENFDVVYGYKKYREWEKD